MFNLFKKAKATQQSSSVTVEQLHNEFYSVEDLLVKESENTAKDLAENSEKEALARQLSGLGFYQSSNTGAQVVALDKLRAIEWYQQNNPLHRFIDEESVIRICEKYNLYLCDVGDYIGEIPLKNQKEIIDFRVKETALNNTKRIEWPRYDSDLMKVSLEYKKEVDEAFRKREEKIEELDHSMELVGCCDLKIIAPESMIDMRRKKKLGHQIVKDDPIVLQPVKWGYLIVTAWGEESSDESVVNGIKN